MAPTANCSCYAEKYCLLHCASSSSSPPGFTAGTVKVPSKCWTSSTLGLTAGSSGSHRVVWGCGSHRAVGHVQPWGHAHTGLCGHLGLWLMWGHGSWPHLWATGTPVPSQEERKPLQHCPTPPFLPQTTPHIPHPPTSPYHPMSVCPMSRLKPTSGVLLSSILLLQAVSPYPPMCLYPPQPPQSPSRTFSNTAALPHSQPGISQVPRSPQQHPVSPPALPLNPHISFLAPPQPHPGPPGISQTPQSLTGPPSPAQDPHSHPGLS